MQLLPFSATQYYMTQDWGSLTIAGLNKHLYINTFIIKIQILKKAESSVTTGPIYKNVTYSYANYTI